MIYMINVCHLVAAGIVRSRTVDSDGTTEPPVNLSHRFDLIESRPRK